MEYKINRDNFRIELNGSKKEVKRFARCLVEIVDKNLLSELKCFKWGDELQQFNLDANKRVYLSRNSLLYVPNVGVDKYNNLIIFKTMEAEYKQAKENFMKYEKHRSILNLFKNKTEELLN
jgi:hypothetical protein